MEVVPASSKVVLAAVGVGAGGFPVVTLVGAVGDHAVDVEAAVAFAPHLPAESDLCVGFAFVAQAIFRRCASSSLVPPPPAVAPTPERR